MSCVVKKNMEDMSEESAHPLESHLVACVQESLSLYMQENAIFLAERLVAEFPTEVMLFF